jgi:hypothetical protein
MAEQETSTTIVQTNADSSKRPIKQTRGPCKKVKAHKDIPEYTIIEDDAELVEEKV